MCTCPHTHTRKGLVGLGGCDSVRDGGFLGQLRLMEDEIESDQVLVPAFIKLRKESLADTVTFSMVNVQGMFLSDLLTTKLGRKLKQPLGHVACK